MTAAQLFRLARERFLVSNDAALRSHLNEFRDHHLLATRCTPRSFYRALLVDCAWLYTTLVATEHTSDQPLAWCGRALHMLGPA